jgi:hypothetical protein
MPPACPRFLGAHRAAAKEILFCSAGVMFTSRAVRGQGVGARGVRPLRAARLGAGGSGSAPGTLSLTLSLSHTLSRTLGVEMTTALTS